MRKQKMEKSQEFTPHPLFDALLADMRRRRGDKVRNNDAALCRELGVLAPTLSKMRKGKLPVSDYVRCQVMRKFHWSIKRLDELAPPAPVDAPAEQGRAH
jgi:hypothetical protein